MGENKKIIAAVPFHLDDGGRIFGSDGAGFQKVQGDLRMLSELAADAASQNAIDAIPSSIAHLLKIHSDARNKKLEHRYQEERWRKAMVIFVLSRYRAYQIETDIIKKESCNAYSWKLFGRKIAQKTGTEGCVCMLRFLQNDVAVFDKEDFLLPIAEFPWKVEKLLGENCIEELMGYEKDVLLTYLEKLDKQVQDHHYIKSFIKDLKEYGAKMVDNLLYVNAGSFGTLRQAFGEENAVWDCFLNIPDLVASFPKVFHTSLILALTEVIDDRIAGFGKTLTFQFAAEISRELFNFSGFLPLTEQMTDYLEQNSDKIRLKAVEADYSEFVDKMKITIELTFVIGSQNIVLKRTYEKEHIRFADSVPLIMVFPYVHLPAANWKRYYQVLKPNENIPNVEVPAFQEFISGFESVPGISIDMADEDMQRSTEADEEENREHWYYCIKETLPKFIKLCIADYTVSDGQINIYKKENYIGCIDVGEPEVSQSIFNRTYHWALDMGTRNTIAAYHCGNSDDSSHMLIRGGLFCPLVYSQGKIYQNFARQCYAPFEKVENRFPTMARIYREGMGNHNGQCYMDGCALFSNTSLMSVLIEKSRNWRSSAILTDIKFGRQDDEHDKALQIFLHNMLWLGSLECVLNGAQKICLYISFPRSDVRSRIEKIWREVIPSVQKVTAVQFSIDFCSEAEANSRYLYKALQRYPQKRISRNGVYGICDIGDGTSDFNLYLGGTDDGRQERIQFSMRYAGGDILVDTIMHFSEEAVLFKEFWNIPSETSTDDENNENKLIQKYMDLFQEDAEKTFESRRNIVLTLIEGVGLRSGLSFSSSKALHDFVVVLTFKYWNLFHVYGELLRKFKTESGSFKLFLYGGGRLALKDAVGEPLDRFTKTDFGSDITAYLSSQAGVEHESFYMDLGEEQKQKTEVVDGLLTIDIPNISTNDPYMGKKVDDYYALTHMEILPGKILDEEHIAQLLEGYQFYIQDIQDKAYFKLEGNTKCRNIYEAVSIGDHDRRYGTLEADNYAFFRNSLAALWEEVTEDEDNPGCLWEVLFYSKMADALLKNNVP